jgi:hypothetical protein
MVGDVLIAQEHPGILWHVRWDGEEFDANEVAQVSQWEHVTFSSAGISEIAVLPPTTGTDDGTGTLLLAALGILAIVVVAGTGGMFLARRRRVAVLGADMALRRPAGRDPDLPVFAAPARSRPSRRMPGSRSFRRRTSVLSWARNRSPSASPEIPPSSCLTAAARSGPASASGKGGRYMLHNLSRLGSATVGNKPVRGPSSRTATIFRSVVPADLPDEGPVRGCLTARACGRGILTIF